MSQMEMVDLDSLVPATHAYRRIQQYVPDVQEIFAEVIHLKWADEYGIDRLFRCLLLQFMKDLSDRDLQRYVKGSSRGRILSCASSNNLNQLATA